MPIFRLGPQLAFPPPDLATEEGIVAIGGDLGLERLLLAYRCGIFPWYSKGEPIIWWSPDPRFVLFPARLKVAKSLVRVIRSGRFTVTFDKDFPAVIKGCRNIRRPFQEGTWITDEMMDAYCALHKAGHAHSVEAWLDGELAGGLYGVAVGNCFCGESMFARMSNASKVAFVKCVEQLSACGFKLIDCQVYTDHLSSFGAEEIPRSEFLDLLEDCLSGARSGCCQSPVTEATARFGADPTSPQPV